MSAATVSTLVRMMESLPDPVQDRVVEHVREYIEDLRDELRWNSQFEASQAKLSRAARKAREQIAQGHSKSGIRVLDPLWTGA